MSLTLQYPLGSYSDTNKPANLTLMADLSSIEATVNAQETILDAQVAMLDTDGTLAANSDTKIASQKAVKTYADTKLTIPTAWSSYVPTFTNLTVGNGTLTAYYKQIGKIVFVRMSLVFGTTTSIAGSTSFTLPVTAVTHSGTATHILGNVGLLDSGTFAGKGHIGYGSPTSATLYYDIVSGSIIGSALLSSTSPWTWTTNDAISANFMYEAA